MQGSFRTLFLPNSLPSSGPCSATPPSSSSQGETFHPASPRASQSDLSPKQNKAERAPTGGGGDEVTMQVPRAFAPVVRAFINAQNCLESAQSALNTRGQRMVEYLQAASPDATEPPQDEEVLEDNAPSGPRDSFFGVNLVKRDLAECDKEIKYIKRKTAVFNEVSARRAECELVDDGVKDLQREADDKFSSVRRLVDDAVKEVTTLHAAGVASSVKLFLDAREAFTVQEGTFGKLRQSLARKSMEKLEEIRRRMQRIVDRKQGELKDVKGRLSTHDPYDPEMSTLQRTSTQLDGEVSIVAGQLMQVEHLREDLELALGGRAEAMHVLGAEFLEALKVASDPPSRVSPTVAVPPELPALRVAATNVSTGDVDGHQRASARPILVRSRDQEENRQHVSDEVQERKKRAREASGALPVRVAAPTAQAPIVTQARASNSGREAACTTEARVMHETESVPQERGGVLGFFKAIVKKATTFDDDEDDEEEEEEPPRQRRRLDGERALVESDSDDSSEYNV